MHTLTPVETVVTAPLVPAMTVDYARRHLRSLTISEDRLIEGWIQGAAQMFCAMTGRSLITETRELWLDTFPWERRILLPQAPLQSVVSVKYIAGDGTLTDFTDSGSPATNLFQFRAPAGPYAGHGWVEPVYGTCWPIARCESGAVRIQYTCGYGDDADAIPELVTTALCYLVANYDQFRAAVELRERGSIMEVPWGVKAMLQEFTLYPPPPLHAPISGMTQFGGWTSGGWPWP